MVSSQPGAVVMHQCSPMWCWTHTQPNRTPPAQTLLRPPQSPLPGETVIFGTANFVGGDCNFSCCVVLCGCYCWNVFAEEPLSLCVLQSQMSFLPPIHPLKYRQSPGDMADGVLVRPRHLAVQAGHWVLF